MHVLSLNYNLYKTNRFQVAVHPGGGVLPYMGHIGMCRCEGYGFQAVLMELKPTVELHTF